jgi:hypothetical protein
VKTKGNVTRRDLIDALAANRTRKAQMRAIGFRAENWNSSIRKLMRRYGLASKTLPCGVPLITSRNAK